MSAYGLQAAFHPGQGPWGAAPGLQPLPDSTMHLLALQAQLQQLNFAGCSPSALSEPPRHAAVAPMSGPAVAAPEPQGLQGTGTGVFIPQYHTDRWPKRRQRNRSPRADKRGAAANNRLPGARAASPGSPTSTLQPLEPRPHSSGCPVAALPCDDDFTEAYSRH